MFQWNTKSLQKYNINNHYFNHFNTHLTLFRCKFERFIIIVSYHLISEFKLIRVYIFISTWINPKNAKKINRHRQGSFHIFFYSYKHIRNRFFQTNWSGYLSQRNLWFLWIDDDNVDILSFQCSFIFLFFILYNKL